MPLSTKQLTRLHQAMEQARKALKPFREERLREIRQYVGHNYGSNGTKDKVPVNLIDLAVSVYGRQLAARAPRAFITTARHMLKPFAHKLQLAVNRLSDQVELGKSFRSIVADALFSMGIAKVGFDRGRLPRETGTRMSGMPFVERVDLDDFGYDPAARRMDEAHFVFNDYVMLWDDIQEHPAFDGPGMRKITPESELRGTNEDDGDDRVETISKEDHRPVDTYKDIIRCRDVYLPQDNRIVTFALDGPDEPLRESEWDGPTHGPYRYLAMKDVPNNIMPLSPISLLIDLHDICNRLFRKMSRQAERQKTLLLVRRIGSEDGDRVIDASDGEAIGVDNPDSTREARFGGADPTTLALVIQLRDMFTYLGGNLNSLGGLSPQAQTLGQDQLLLANSSKLVADMQDRVIDFARGILHDLAWWLWTDPLIELPLIARITPDWSLPTAFTWKDRIGEFLEYNFQVEPYSMQHETPGQRMQVLMQLVQTIIMPMADRMQAAGVTFNFQEFLRIIAEYTNMHELEDLFIFSGPPLYGSEMPGTPPQKFNFSHRKYERINRPSATTEGKNQAQIAGLMNVPKQPAEMAQIGRMVG